ncbi:MAG: division/cell wall cluster transcriptional repressor MraZ [Epsilonproteobacteria bacterium]|nr:division/cell wall cluster transcriptional repressor MraZ [Campylobacterota bacterium]
MFRGRYNFTIDSKGRVSIPSRFREQIKKDYASDILVLTSLDQSVFVYPDPVWQKIEEKARTLPLSNKQARQFLRLFFSGASESSIDSHGRITVAPFLMEYAGLNRDVMIIGNLDHIEIWDKNRWYDTKKTIENNQDLITESISKLGIF